MQKKSWHLWFLFPAEVDFSLAQGPPRELNSLPPLKSPTSTERFTSPAHSQRNQEGINALFPFVSSTRFILAMLFLFSLLLLTWQEPYACLRAASFPAGYQASVGKPGAGALSSLRESCESSVWYPFQTCLDFLLHYSRFKMLHQFLLYNKVSQLCVCICAPPHKASLPPHLTPLGHQRAWSWAPCAIKRSH